MSIFAIGDLHLAGHNQKPMAVFGSQWEHHFDKISSNWKAKVTENDLVLIPGDISWAMRLEDAADDLKAIGLLPGKKILLRGNHDYWWSTPSKIRKILPENMFIIQNNSLLFEHYAICGTRAWNFPTEEEPLTPEDQAIYERELIRLRLSLESIKDKNNCEILVMLHFPPLFANGCSSLFCRIAEEYHVKHVVYGHLHGNGIKNAYIGEKNDINYSLVSCDAIDFNPRLIIDC